MDAAKYSCLQQLFKDTETKPVRRWELGINIKQYQTLSLLMNDTFYIFLDFDGVLHPGNGGSFRYRDNFEDLLRKHQNALVIISSDWGINASLEYLRTYFSADVKERFISILPDYKVDWSRQQSIEAFCRENGIHRWIAIDDSADLFPGRPQWLFLTNRRVALNKEETNRLYEFIETFFVSEFRCRNP